MRGYDNNTNYNLILKFSLIFCSIVSLAFELFRSFWKHSKTLRGNLANALGFLKGQCNEIVVEMGLWGSSLG
jgi:hypothetical protein